ncbi:hypothetical protein BgiBS90_005980 [Biomphalaria glabrata]|nr:hypothetical protein BgiBS90_005980 [Biomphalaria glabrata]
MTEAAVSGNDGRGGSVMERWQRRQCQGTMAEVAVSGNDASIPHSSTISLALQLHLPPTTPPSPHRTYTALFQKHFSISISEGDQRPDPPPSPSNDKKKKSSE